MLEAIISERVKVMFSCQVVRLKMKGEELMISSV